MRQKLKLGRGVLILILLFVLYCGSTATALEGSVNATAVAVGPAGEEIEGDPDQPVISGVVVSPGAETTGIEHEDIGIADPELTSTQGDDDSKVNTEIEVEREEAATPEIDDEVLVAFGDGERGAFKVEVRGWDPKDKEAAKTQYSESDLNFILTRAARNEGELEEYTKALSQSDPNIEKIVISESLVALNYRFPAKILGLINIDYTYRAEVDATGRVKVKLPWYLFLTQNNAGDVTADLEEQLATVGDDAQLANIDLQNALQKQQQTLQTMSNVSKARHDIAMASIRNTRA